MGNSTYSPTSISELLFELGNKTSTREFLRADTHLSPALIDELLKMIHANREERQLLDSRYRLKLAKLKGVDKAELTEVQRKYQLGIELMEASQKQELTNFFILQSPSTMEELDAEFNEKKNSTDGKSKVKTNKLIKGIKQFVGIFFIPIALIGFSTVVTIAQPALDTINTYPTITSNTRAYGATFEVNSSDYLFIKKFMLSGYTSGSLSSIDIYYRLGGVESVPGTPPVIHADSGWIFWKSTTLYTEERGVPRPTDTDINLILPSGTNGIFIASSNGLVVYPGVAPITTYTKTSVTMNVGARKGYGGTYPNMASDAGLVGGFIYYTFPYINNDAGIFDFQPPIAFCSSSQAVEVDIMNYGSNPITSVQVNWEVNGVAQPTVNYTGTINTIASGSSYTATVPLGSYPFALNSNDKIEVWTSMPNAVADAYIANDMALDSAGPSLNGEYTVDWQNSTGGTNFNTFKEMADALNMRGICGPVVINAMPGTYEGRFSLDKINGSSAINTILIQGDSSGVVTIVDSSDGTPNNYVVRLNGCSYITLKGLKLNSLHDRYLTNILYEDSAHHNTVKGCELMATTNPSSTSTTTAIIYSRDYEGNDYNVIEDNYIYGGSFGIYFRGENHSDPNGADLVSGVVIKDNLIEDCYRYGMYLYETKDLIVSGNTIKTTTNYTGASYGVYFYYNSGFKVVNNEIYSYGREWPRYGIRMQNCHNDSLDRGLFANNMMHVGDSSSSSGFNGVYLNNCTNVDVFHNNVVLEEKSLNSQNYFYNGSGNKVYNNNFLHYGYGAAIYTDGTSADFNFNNIASANDTLICVSTSASDPIINDLSEWNSMGFGANSISVDSIFSNLDSLRTCSDSLVGRGMALDNVPMDIDDEKRNETAPNIGADEYVISYLDYSIGDTIEHCNGTELVLGNPVDYVSYLWSTSDTTETITITDENNYSVTINGACASATDTVTVVDVHPTIEFDYNFANMAGLFVNEGTNGTSFHWDFGDSTYSTDANPYHVYQQGGFYDVTFTIMNMCDTLTLTKEIYVHPVGIASISLTTQLSIYPNPASNYVNLTFGQIDQQLVQVQLQDTRGKQIVQKQFNVSKGSTEQLDVSGISKGIYLIRIRTLNETMSRQLVIQ